MGASKRYKGKDCAYCRGLRISETNDHVVPRAFFLDDDRAAGLTLPQVPACAACNNEKSKLEEYASSMLLAGTEHVDAERYRLEKVRPRLQRNAKLRAELRLDRDPEWVRINGVLQKMHMISLQPEKLSKLLEFIVLGLYRYHLGKPLLAGWRAQAQMIAPENEHVFLSGLSPDFPPGCWTIEQDLGRGAFTYWGIQSAVNEWFSIWAMSLHGTRLYGEGASANRWWCVTRPTEELVAETKADDQERDLPP